MKIMVAGSVASIDRIISVAVHYDSMGHDVRNPFYWLDGDKYLKIEYDALLDAKRRAIQNLFWADKVVFVRKPDKTLGESTTFELAFCMETGKEYEIID